MMTIDAAALAANLDNPLWRIGYVYTITNRATGKLYVGSSVDYARRFYLHKRSLRAGNHHSPILQHAWNKYSSEEFSFEVVETVPDVTFLVAREQFWIWRSEGLLMNCSMTAGSPLGVKRTAEQKAFQSEIKRKFYKTPFGRAVIDGIHAKTRGRKQSAEERAMRSQSAKGKKKSAPWTDEQRKAHSIALTGREMPPVAESTKRNISLAKTGVRRSAAANEAVTRAMRARNELWIAVEKPAWLAFIAQGISLREIERITGRCRKVIARECKGE